jgi:nucleotide-binding universal stress UspA family protein
MSTSKQQSDVDVQAALQEIQRSQDQLLNAFETLADRLGESLPISEGSVEQDSIRKKAQDGASDKGGCCW